MDADNIRKVNLIEVGAQAPRGRTLGRQPCIGQPGPEICRLKLAPVIFFWHI